LKIVDQSHEILFSDIEDISLTKKIEIAARTCYKSEDKIKENSDIDLCTKLINRGHEAMLEHGNIVLITGEEVYKILKAMNYPFLRFTEHINTNRLGYTRYIVSGNVRTWRDLYRQHPFAIMRGITNFFKANIPLLFDDLDTGFMDNQAPGISLVKDASVLSKVEQFTHRTITVRFVTDRGVSHELVRHRKASFAQESTRYVKYDGEMGFIRPVFDWGTDIENKLVEMEFSSMAEEGIACNWYTSVVEAEVNYQSMLKHGASPQQARSVLPNSLKTEIIVTTNLSHWYDIFKLRVSPAAHPQIKELMKPVLEQVDKLINA
jgi:thymidylate synthase (FAD)